jgi:hypothetical protein
MGSHIFRAGNPQAGVPKKHNHPTGSQHLICKRDGGYPDSGSPVYRHGMSVANSWHLPYNITCNVYIYFQIARIIYSSTC